MVEQLCSILRKDVSEYLHKYIHYDVNVTMALVYTQDDAAGSIIGARIRDTDKMIRISPHLYAVIYQYTNSDKESSAAVENLEKNIHGRENSLIAYTHFHESDKDADTIIIRLYEIFEDLFKKQDVNTESDADYFKTFMKNHITTEDL